MTPPLAKAVIPAAGFGTRMLPAAKAVPKELLPVLDRPVIQYVVDECAAAGLADVLLVSSPAKPALVDHFRPNPPLEARLDGAGRRALLASVDELMRRVTVSAVMQHEQRGLGDAVLRAREHVGGEAFACLLGDTIFSGGDPPAVQLAAAHARLGTAVIGLEEVPLERVSRYGIVAGTGVGDGVVRVETLVEKPSPADAPSRLAVAARYVLTPRVFECLAEVPPGNGGEVQLTDALQLLCEREVVHGVVLSARRHDIGNPVDWLRTNLAFAAADPAVWPMIAPLVRSLAEADAAVR